jgi:hypothetical protein
MGDRVIGNLDRVIDDRVIDDRVIGERPIARSRIEEK